MELNQIFGLVKKEGRVVVYDSATGEAFEIKTLSHGHGNLYSNECHEGLTDGNSVDKINREIASIKEDDFIDPEFDDDYEFGGFDEWDDDEEMYFEEDEDEYDVDAEEYYRESFDESRRKKQNRWDIPRSRRREALIDEDEDKQYLEEIPF